MLLLCQRDMSIEELTRSNLYSTNEKLWISNCSKMVRFNKEGMFFAVRCVQTHTTDVDKCDEEGRRIREIWRHFIEWLMCSIVLVFKHWTSIIELDLYNIIELFLGHSSLLSSFIIYWEMWKIFRTARNCTSIAKPNLPSIYSIITQFVNRVRWVNHYSIRTDYSLSPTKSQQCNKWSIRRFYKLNTY